MLGWRHTVADLARAFESLEQPRDASQRSYIGEDLLDRLAELGLLVPLADLLSNIEKCREGHDSEAHSWVLKKLDLIPDTFHGSLANQERIPELQQQKVLLEGLMKVIEALLGRSEATIRKFLAISQEVPADTLALLTSRGIARSRAAMLLSRTKIELAILTQNKGQLFSLDITDVCKLRQQLAIQAGAEVLTFDALASVLRRVASTFPRATAAAASTTSSPSSSPSGPAAPTPAGTLPALLAGFLSEPPAGLACRVFGRGSASAAGLDDASPPLSAAAGEGGLDDAAAAWELACLVVLYLVAEDAHRAGMGGGGGGWWRSTGAVSSLRTSSTASLRGGAAAAGPVPRNVGSLSSLRSERSPGGGGGGGGAKDAEVEEAPRAAAAAMAAALGLPPRVLRRPLL